MRKRQAFTLVELLVVIGIVAILIAILLPVLHRVKREAKAVMCQSNLHQWGSVWLMYTGDNDGCFPRWGGWIPGPGPAGGHRAPTVWYDRHWVEKYYMSNRGMQCCPMATKKVQTSMTSTGVRFTGGTFRAWGFQLTGAGLYSYYGSYGLNWWVYLPTGREAPKKQYPFKNFWGRPDVAGASNIPVFLDSCGREVFMRDWASPPVCDAVPSAPFRVGGVHHVCINRHDGYVNSLFMDWSVRNVGLKELWTLKWHRQFDTANDWTKAGRVRPGDWPEWMRGFKDY